LGVAANLISTERLFYYNRNIPRPAISFN
jgi:hypothetical protein